LKKVVGFFTNDRFLGFGLFGGNMVISFILFFTYLFGQ
jgi:hypothetical protein